MKKLLCIIMVILLGIAAVACTPTDEFVGRIGYVLEQGDYIYYINGGGSPSLIADNYNVASGALCRMKKDGSFRQIIVPMCIGSYQIAGDKIFTVSVLKDSAGYEVGVCGLDGSGYKTVTNISSGSIQYAGGWLFVLDDTTLYRMSPQGYDKEVISKLDMTSAVFDTQYIYYTYKDALESGLYRMEHNGKNITKLVSGECYIIKENGEDIYYQDNGGDRLNIYNKTTGKSTGMVYTYYEEFVFDFDRMIAFGARDEDNPGIVATDMNTGETKTVCEDYAICLNFYKGKLYYINGSDNNFIYEVDPNTGAKRLITASVPQENGYGIADGYIYYISPNEGNKPYRVHIESLERQEIGIRKTA